MNNPIFPSIKCLTASAVGLWVGLQVSTAYAEVPEIINATGLAHKMLSTEPSPLSGVDVITLIGGRVVYVSKDGQFLFDGRLIGHSETGPVDLTAPLEMRARVQALDALPVDSYVSYRPRGEFRSYITVFTDVGCPFCQRFHGEVAALTNAGVGVRYLPYPRAGLDSEDFAALQSVWCAKEPADALDRAKSKGRVQERNCASTAVRTSYELGQAMGVRGRATASTHMSLT